MFSFLSSPSILILLIFFLVTNSLAKPIKNGFDLENSIIFAENILQGGPPKEGIPSIDHPIFEQANQVDFLQEDDRILGITFKGLSRAYPIKILNWHEIINDVIEETAIVISYCPLCGTGMIFQAKVKGQALTFGVSGLLYNSDVLLYDRQTQTLWSQILAKAISGKGVGTKLKTMPAIDTTWALWKQQHPDTWVLSTQTGYQRNYNQSPYGHYDSNDALYFPVVAKSKRYHPKERVLGLSIKGKHKAYPFVELSRHKENKIIDTFADQILDIEFNAEKRTGTIKDKMGNVLVTTNSFWFAWYAFHPDTEIYSITK